MKILNVVNFIRQHDPRSVGAYEKLFKATKEEIEQVKKYKIDNTFLLQYDTMCDFNYVDLFKKNRDEKMELGFWYEVVEPLTSAVGLPYKSENGWKWDWHITPGFSMSYSIKERELLIDEAMRKFKEVFGEYPKSVGSWVIDTYTINYLYEKYHIDAVCYCRDQINTDAYTLTGGYFNQCYYPSKNNMFTPAQSREYQVDVPIFRMLGPCPLHSYSREKYLSDKWKGYWACYTFEAAGYTGNDDNMIEWFYDTYYENESLNFAYMTAGQENSFAYVVDNLGLYVGKQIERGLKRKNIKFMKLCDTGKLFKEKFKETPATSLIALNDWDKNDAQSVYYDCKNYTVNLFRYKNQLFFKTWYLFDERVEDNYLNERCTRFDAVYENLPYVDSVVYNPDRKTDVGLLLDDTATDFKVKSVDKDSLKVYYGDKEIIFSEDIIKLNNFGTVKLFKDSTKATVSMDGNVLSFEYKKIKYSLNIDGGKITEADNYFEISGDKILIKPIKE